RKTVELSRKMPEHVVLIFEYGFEQKINRWFEIQEYAKFGSLLDFVRSRSLYSNTNFVREVVKELSECIHALHTQGIVHRDLKPSNVLVRDEHPLDLVLTDFGISSLLEEDVSKIFSTVKGTYAYFAPESFSGYFGKEVDWWALGVILLELLTSKNPLSGLAPQVIMHTISTKGIEIPEELREEWKLLLKGLLTRDPKKRWGYEQIQRWLRGDTNIPVYYQGEVKEASIKEWLKYGFTEKSAEKWKEIIDDPEVAKNFKEEGFTPEEAALWVKVGLYNVKTIKSWISAGYTDPTVVRIYEDHDVNPKTARELENAGVDHKTFLYICESYDIQPRKLLDLAEWLKKKNKAEKQNLSIAVFLKYYMVLNKYVDNLDKIYQTATLGIDIEDKSVVENLELLIREKDRYGISSEDLFDIFVFIHRHNTINTNQQVSIFHFIEYFLNARSKGIDNYREALDLYLCGIGVEHLDKAIELYTSIFGKRITKENAKKTKELLEAGVNIDIIRSWEEVLGKINEKNYEYIVFFLRNNISSEEFMKWLNLIVNEYKLDVDTFLNVLLSCKAKGVSLDEFEKLLKLVGWRQDILEFIEQCKNSGCEISQVVEYIEHEGSEYREGDLSKILKDVIKHNKIIGLNLYNNMYFYVGISYLIYAVIYTIINSTSLWNFVKHAFLGVVIFFLSYIAYYFTFRHIIIGIIGNLAYYILRISIIVRTFTILTTLAVTVLSYLILGGILAIKNADVGVWFFLGSTVFLLILTIKWTFFR
ncbi:MAG: protein kinase, partial [Aquificaceae bacterium]|nr:protein kinase [Aquificaceae bacterium]